MSIINITNLSDVQPGDRVSGEWHPTFSRSDWVPFENTLAYKDLGNIYVLGNEPTGESLRNLTITREIPDLPTEPGTTGTATVGGVKGIRVMLTYNAGSRPWVSARDAGDYAERLSDADLTDFVPDVTARYVEAQPDSGPHKPAMPAHWVIERGSEVIARTAKPIDVNTLADHLSLRTGIGSHTAGTVAHNVAAWIEAQR